MTPGLRRPAGRPVLRKTEKTPTGEPTVKRPIRTILALIAALATLTACSTVGGVVDGTGKAISKGGRAVKNI